jgi:hypothetical protein
MRLTSLLFVVPLLLRSVAAFPRMSTPEDLEAIKRSLDAISADPELMAEIHNLMEEQKAELEV